MESRRTNFTREENKMEEEVKSPGTMVDEMFKEAIALAYKRGYAAAVKEVNESIAKHNKQQTKSRINHHSLRVVQPIPQS